MPDTDGQAIIDVLQRLGFSEGRPGEWLRCWYAEPPDESRGCVSVCLRHDRTIRISGNGSKGEGLKWAKQTKETVLAAVAEAGWRVRE